MEASRRKDKLPSQLRDSLRTGEWSVSWNGASPAFHPAKKFEWVVEAPGREVALDNPFKDQPLRFSVEALPRLAPPGSLENTVLFESAAGLDLPAAGPKDPMPGYLSRRIDLLAAGRPRDLTKSRALAIRVRADFSASAAGAKPDALDIQLEAVDGTLRDYIVDIDFIGERRTTIREPSTERILPEFWPDVRNFSFKSSMREFDYSRVRALNVRWLRRNPAGSAKCELLSVEALAEGASSADGIEISIEGKSLSLPAAIGTGNYVEYVAEDAARFFDSNGRALEVFPIERRPVAKAGKNIVKLIVMGAPIKVIINLVGD
jgi:hypothetical protein